MALDAESEAIGNLLYDRGVLTDAQLDEAEDLAEAWNLGLVEVLLGKRWLKAATIYRELAYYYDVPLLDLSETPADTALLRRYDVTEMTEAQVIPVREENGRLTVATALFPMRGCQLLDPSLIEETAVTPGLPLQEFCRERTTILPEPLIRWGIEALLWPV